jgi:hypothetical protein
MTLYDQWLQAKEEERQAVEARRVIEDELIESFQVDDSKDGSKTYKPEGYKVKVTTRLNRKVDADQLMQLAAEAGIDNDHLQALFRWKPEINLREWQNAAETITNPLQAAITTKPGRPSFSIERVEK